MKIPDINKHTIDDQLGDILFKTRWILYPMNMGLALAGAIYAIKFMMDLWQLVMHGWSMSTEEVMLGVLSLVDMLMVANLIVMIYKGSHQIFIQRFLIADPTNRPQWLDHVDSGILKIKMASSVAGITLIRLLKDFVNIEHVDWNTIVHRCIVHGVVLCSCIVMAAIWRMTHFEPHQAVGQEPEGKDHEMTFYLKCLLCDQTNPKTSPYLVPMQEHVMSEHGYTREDLQKTTKRETDEGYIYTFPDGKDWLDAVKGGNHVGGL